MKKAYHPTPEELEIELITHMYMETTARQKLLGMAMSMVELDPEFKKPQTIELLRVLLQNKPS